MPICPDDNFGRCPVCGGVGDDNSDPGSAFSTYAVPANLVSNGNFVDGVTSDWTQSEVALTVAQETTIVKGGYSVKLTPGAYIGIFGSQAQYIYQDVHEAEGISYWQGKRVTLCCWVKTDTAEKVNIRIYDGVGRSSSLYHSGNGQWELLKVTRLIDASATMVRIELVAFEYLFLVPAYSAYFDGAAAADNEDLALSVQARILREAKVDADSDVTIRTDKDKGYKLEYYQGELMCQLCIKTKKKEAEDEIAVARRREEQELRDRFGFRKSMED